MNGYEKIPDEDQALAPKIRGVEPPAYAHVNVDEESRGSDVDEEQSCSPGRLFCASTLAALACFWPAALVGMVYSVKARFADSPRANQYLKVGKKFVWLSFWVGVVIMVVMTIVQVVVVMQVGKSVYKGAMHGYVDGLHHGMEKGSADAKELVKNNMLAKFPEHVPASPSFFDINSPFWQEMLQAEEPRHAGKVVGQAFGWVDGYKKGFCASEQADCTGVNMATLSDYVVKCDHMRAKMDRMQKKMGKHQHGEKHHKGSHGHDDKPEEAKPEEATPEEAKPEEAQVVDQEEKVQEANVQ